MMKRSVIGLSALFSVGVANGQDLLDPVVVFGERIGRGAVGEVEVDEIGAERVSEVLGFVPGFSAVTSDSAGYGDTISIRGTGNPLFFGPAGVAMVVDGVPYGDVFGYSTEFFDLEGMRVLRGAQGSRFGRNAVGGVIQMETARPADELALELSAEYGSYDLRHYRAKVSGPLGEDLSFVLQSYFKQRNGYLENVNPAVGGFTDDREQLGVLGSLFFNPSEDMEVRFRALYERSRDGSQRLSAVPGGAAVWGGAEFLRVTEPFQVASDLAGMTDSERYQLSMHVNQDFGWGRLISVTSVQRWELGPNEVDLDLSPQVISFSDIDHRQDVVSQEFRLESDDEGDFRWSAGLAYLYKTNEGIASRSFLSIAGPSLLTQVTDFELEEHSLAFFGHAEWDLSDRLAFDAGVRVEYVETEMDRTISGLGFPDRLIGEADGWYVSPSVGVSLDLSDGVEGFLRSSVAFKPQGFTAYTTNPALAGFDEERSWETEVGVRFENGEKNFAGELRAYYKQIDDYQYNQSIPLATDFVILNAEEVEAYGVEAELRWKPTERLVLSASAGWGKVEGEFRRFDGLGGFTVGDDDAPYVPEFTASLAARVDLGRGFYGKVAGRAVGRTSFQIFGSGDFDQGAYQVWDAELGYKGERWNVAVFGRNLFDEEYYTFMNEQIYAGAPGDPQVFGVRAGIKF